LWENCQAIKFKAIVKNHQVVSALEQGRDLCAKIAQRRHVEKIERTQAES
jgi:hypothetical protein